MKKYPVIIILVLFLAGVVFGNTLREKRGKTRVSAENETELRVHVGSWIRVGFYDNLFRTLEKEPRSSEKKIVAAIVNHHLFAPDLIARTFHTISARQPSVILLISPNHYFLGRTAFIASAYDWITTEGTIEADRNLLRRLPETDSFGVEESVFEKEHGITNEVGFLKHYFPNATIVPVVVREEASETDIDLLADKLNMVLSHDALVVGSFDFSHYVREDIALKQDEKSIEVLRSMDITRIAEATLDSKKGLSLVLRLANLRGATTFHLIGRSSSALRVGDMKTTENTSYVCGFFF